MPSSPTNVLQFRKPAFKKSASEKQQGNQSAQNPGKISGKSFGQISSQISGKISGMSKPQGTQPATGKTQQKPAVQTIRKTVYIGRTAWKNTDARTPKFRFAGLLKNGKKLARRIVNIALLLLLLVGAGTVWDAAVGDGSLPTLNDLSVSAPQLSQLAQGNSTATLPLAQAQANYWESLSTTRQLMLSLSPQIAFWLLELHQNGHIIAHTPGDIHKIYHVSADTALLAAYRHNENALYLGEAFWKLSDGQKAAVIAHEYRHSRQNAGKRLSYQIAHWMSLGQLNRETPMENEAMDYERQAETALGIR